jgi:hypothetical protein
VPSPGSLSIFAVPGQLTAPRAALTVAMIAPPSAMDTNERMKPVPKKRHRIQARLTNSKAIVAGAVVGALFPARRSAGQLPQAFTHLALISGAFNLDQALSGESPPP